MTSYVSRRSLRRAPQKSHKSAHRAAPTDIPLRDDVKGTIAAQLDADQARLAAIRHDHHGAVPLLPGPAPGAKPGTLGGDAA